MTPSPTGKSRPPRSTGKAAAPIPREESQQAQDHQRTREAHRRELMEDYVEVIADLIDDQREARVTDIAKRLGVSHVTVTKAIERLQREGLVDTQPYRSVFLTAAGWEAARAVRHRHHIVLAFLLAIGVREDTALTDAEGIEHHVSEETLGALEKLLERLSK